MTTDDQIILIGASLGGITALSSFANSMAKDFPIPIVAVIHTAASSLNLMDKMIQPFTGLNVAYATDGEELRPGNIYLAPPDHHLVICEKNRITLEEGPKVRDSRPAVDRLFGTAASIYGSGAIGVVLTGADGDGAQGLREIKAAGGISIVQNPGEARDPSMPNSALAKSLPDYCVSLDDLADLLKSLVLEADTPVQADHSSL